MTLLIKSTPENRKLIFNAIKAKILKHLEELEREESGELKKTFSELTGLLLKGGKGLPVGTIREWKGKKFIKVAPGKWKPKYDSETRGAKLAISALKKKIELCEDEREMMALVLENRDRFSDKDGNPLPFVQQLSEFISQTQEAKKEPHLRAFETEYKKTKEWYANAKATSTEIDDLEQEIRSLERKIKSVKKQGMGDTNPTLAGWYGCQNAQKETLNELKTAKEAGFETLKEYKNAKNSAGSGGDNGGEPPDNFKGKTNEAIAFLLRKKEGEAKNALYHKDIGYIDIVYGKEGTAKSDGYGLAKIAKFHPEVLDNLQEIISSMMIVGKTKNRIQLESKKHKASIRLDWNGESKKWLLTAFEKESDVSDSRTDIAGTDNSRKNDTATPTNIATTSIPQSDEKSSGKIKNEIEKLLEELNPNGGNERGFQFSVADLGHLKSIKSMINDFENNPPTENDRERLEEIVNSNRKQARKLQKIYESTGDKNALVGAQKYIDFANFYNWQLSKLDKIKFSQDFTNLAEAVKNSKDFSIESRRTHIGNVFVESGETGKSGYGIKHIIEQRYKKDGKNIDEITALLPLVLDSVRNGKITRENDKSIELTKNGIVAIVAKQKFGKEMKWVLTGFENTNNKKERQEAEDAIAAVIANNDYALERSYFRKQVGAVIASLSSIPQSDEKSSNNLTKSIVWLQNYLSKSGQKKESAIEVLRKRLEKERRA